MKQAINIYQYTKLIENCYSALCTEEDFETRITLIRTIEVCIKSIKDNVSLLNDEITHD